MLSFLSVTRGAHLEGTDRISTKQACLGMGAMEAWFVVGGANWWVLSGTELEGFVSEYVEQLVE